MLFDMATGEGNRIHEQCSEKTGMLDFAIMTLSRGFLRGYYTCILHVHIRTFLKVRLDGSIKRLQGIHE